MDDETKPASSGRRPPSHPRGRSEFEQSAGCVVVVDDSDRRVALVMRVRREGFELPKGHLEAGETAEQAAVRELCEETGLESVVKLGPELGRVEYQFESAGATVTKRVRYFLATADNRNSLRFGRRPKRTRELRWVALDELPTLPLLRESVREIIRRGLASSTAE